MWMKKYKKTLRKAEDRFGIPRMTLSRRMKNPVTRPFGRPKVLSEEDRRVLAEGLAMCADWGFPLTRRDIRYLVKWRIDSAGIVENRFTDNMPSYQWARKFIDSSPEISERIAQNIKRARAGVNADTINAYFDNMEKSLDGVSENCIINYDETGFVDDVNKDKIVCRRGTKHPERIIDTSKTNISVMFSCTASGVMLPPYVCYKSENLYDSWKLGGPSGSRYNRTKSGWFDGHVFQDWFNTIALPYFENECTVDAKKVMIGDNLASHVSSDVLALCRANNIRFILLPPNATHLCQPLDVSVFRPIKEAWRKELKQWKTTYIGSLRKDHFPALLKKTLARLDTMPKNIQSGFEATGIYPINRAKVLTKLKNRENICAQTSENGTAIQWSEGFVNLLEEQRALTTQVRTRKKRVEVDPGKSLAGDTDSEDEEAADDPIATEAEPEAAPEAVIESDPPQQTAASENITNSDNQTDPGTVLAQPTTSDGSIVCPTRNINPITIEKDDFVIASLIYNFGTRKEITKYFIGRVIAKNVGRGKNQIKVDMLRKAGRNEDTTSFKYPQIRDIWCVDIDQITKKLQPIKERRNVYYFKDDDIGCEVC